jgi:hypothetical protein
MLIHTSPSFQIFFGGQRHSCVPHEVRTSGSAYTTEPFPTIIDELELKNCVLLHQVHGTEGIHIASTQSVPNLFDQDGDYIITHQRHSGIGVVTADCVPIVIYDKVHHVVAIIHAGWRGLVAGIVQQVVNRMVEMCKSDVSQLKVFIGPCAKACCYVVGDEVTLALDNVSFKERVVCSTEQAIHFDMPLFVQLSLRELGINNDACNMHYNQCTICTSGFCSVRTDGTQERNITMVVLK